MLPDTNIVIYLNGGVLPKHTEEIMQSVVLGTCNIIVAEVLGYRGVAQEDAIYFRRLFAAMRNYPFDSKVTDKVIDIRKSINIRLPDAIIAATALVYDLELWTYNIHDFKDVPGIRLFNPLT